MEFMVAQMTLPPVDAARDGWWMTEQGSLSRVGLQLQVGEDLQDAAIAFRDTSAYGTIGVPLIADVDGYGTNELIALHHTELRVWNVVEQRLKWRWSPPDTAIPGGVCEPNHPAVGNVDPDGVLEVVVSGRHGVWVLDRATRVEENPIQHTRHLRIRAVPGGLALSRATPLQVYDVTGRLQFRGTAQTLLLPPGLYTLTFPDTVLRIPVIR